ncbi:MAG TPA: DUF6443 domain-containing protein, partial [Chryseolinea sp.]|nr:DUF6443 domain-containing protein [Chryseolinea sp.]
MATVTNGGSSTNYTWYKNGVQVTGISGPPPYVYVPQTSLTNGDKIKCQVTSNASCGSGNTATSNEFTVVLTSSVAPTVSVQITKLNYCTGENISFTASSSYISGSSTYSWKRNGTQFATTSSTSLPVSSDVNAVNTFRPGDIVTVDVSGLTGTCLTGTTATGTTNNIPFVIYPLPTATINPSGTKTISSTGTQNITASTGTGYTYQWKRNAVVISPGGTVNPYPASLAGSYTVVITANGCTKESNSLAIVKNIAPIANAGLDKTIVLPTSTSALAGTGTDADGTITAFSWRFVSGLSTPILSAPNSANPSLSGLVRGDYVFGLKVTDNAGEQSAEDLITISVVFPPNNYNWIKETNVLVKNKLTEADLVPLQIQNGEVGVTWSYFDGIGRPMQTVNQSGSPAIKDIVSPNVYDGIGRESRKYLPVVVSETNGYYKVNGDIIDNTSGNYKGIASTFYADGSDNKIADDVRPFSETTFEPSPLNRPTKDFGTGKDWFDSNKAINAHYPTNTHGLGNTLNEEKIILWKLNNKLPERNTALNSGYYSTGSLLIKSIKDEQGNEVREYTDRFGQIVLKKVQVKGTVTSLNDPTQWALTYYLYDDFGSLVFVFQPELSKSLLSSNVYNPSPADLNIYAFQYTYDERKRMVVKKMPGADSLFMVYDNRNRLVLTQDGNQRKDVNGAVTKKEWSFIKYDFLNRPVVTGIYTHSMVVSRTEMKSQISTSNFVETYNGVVSTHGYTNIVFPFSNLQILSVTYYDNYNFRTNMAGTAYDYTPGDITNQDALANNNVKGYITGTKVNILGSSNYLWSVTYYDQKYRVIQTKNQNHKSGIDRITNLYDFVSIKETKSFHTNGTVTYSAHRKYDYDHAKRLKRLWHKFHTESSFVLLQQNEYNELGQLVTEKLHSRDNGTTFSQKTDYLFNIRGWMESINNPRAPEVSDLFSMELKFNKPSANGGPAMYNGNISEQVWRSAGLDRQAYGYNYDAMNRLLDANYFNQVRPLSNGRYTEKIIHDSKTPYDLNGNINGLVRYGKSTATTFDKIDGLSYTYAGNQLTSVTDVILDPTVDIGFTELTRLTVGEYTYDPNGNMIKDQNKGITSITYNYLNLPVQVNKGATNYIVYTYDATGRKLTQKVFGATPKTTEYLGEYIYENTAGNDVLQFVTHERGRIVADNIPGATRPWEYQYFLKDHLGNVRVTFSEKKVSTEYNATLETNTQTNEQNTFKNYSHNGFSLFNHTVGGTYSQLLTAGPSSKIGLAKSMTVNPGDIIDLEVYAKYEGAGTLPADATSLFSALVATFGLNSTGGTGIDGKGAYDAFNSTDLFGGGVYVGRTVPYEDETAPRTYLNYILFDENFVLKDFGFDQISESAKQVGATPIVAHDYLNLHVKVQQKGYLYIYLSNEQPFQTNVYFDDLKITYNSGVEQVSEYYPFGLRQASNGFEKQGSTENPFKFQGQEHINELNLEWDSFKWRNYQPDIGRFFNVDPLADKYVYNSPYAFAENKLGLGVELEGLELVPWNEFDQTPIKDPNSNHRIPMSLEATTTTTTTTSTQSTMTTTNIFTGKSTSTTKNRVYDVPGGSNIPKTVPTTDKEGKSSSVSIFFQDTKSDNHGSDNRISTKSVDGYIKGVKIFAGMMNLKSLIVTATTNGTHSNKITPLPNWNNP